MKNIFIRIYLLGNKVLESFGFKLDYIGIMRQRWLQNMNFDAIIDAGASRGQSVSKFRWIFGKNIPIYSFEPITGEYEILSHAFLDDQNLTTYNLGLGSLKCARMINILNSKDSSSLLDPVDLQMKTYNQTVDNHEMIQIDTINNIFQDTKYSSLLLKIDVQGFELELLKGSENIFPKIKCIIVELSYRELYKDQPLFHDVYQYLRAKGYTYIGNFYQSISSVDGSPMQQDAVFILK